MRPPRRKTAIPRPGGALGRGLLVPIALALGLTSCSAAYYSALERVGIEKREILVDRVEDARGSQEDAKEQFRSALDEYRSVIEVDAGELEEIYDRLNGELEESQDRAEEVRERIDEVETVAEDLFEEWEEEIEEYSDSELRQESRRLLAETQDRYGRLIQAMHRAETSMEPVLTLFQDQVLILRHNLNARAIGALETEVERIEGATTALIENMEQAIAEAGRFLESMG